MCDVLFMIVSSPRLQSIQPAARGWLLCHSQFQAGNMLLGEPLDARKTPLRERGHSAGQVRDLAWTRPCEAFSDGRARRAARKVRCRSMFSASAHELKVTKQH
jgi:hypothetical protein